MAYIALPVDRSQVQSAEALLSRTKQQNVQNDTRIVSCMIQSEAYADHRRISVRFTEV